MTVTLDKTIPALTVASPADQTIESSSAVTVSGTLTDALSGASGVTCNGVTATLTGGSFSCNVSLAVGVNLVVVRGTDIAGNVAGDNFHLSLTGTLPVPAWLQVTPTGVNMVVGGTQQFTAVDDHGRPRTDASWSVSNTSIATIDTSSSPTLTAVATGKATLTATVGTVTTNTVVTIGSGTSLSSGTVIWSQPTISGFTGAQIVQGTSPGNSPSLYSIERDSHGDTVVDALSSDGQQLWTSATFANGNFGFGRGYADGNGGVILDLRFATPERLIDLDAQTGTQLWEYDSVNGNGGVALGTNGALYVATGASLIVVDGTTGATKVLYTVPTSTSTSNVPLSSCFPNGPTTTPTDWSILGSPTVGPDGSMYAETSVLDVGIHGHMY